MTRRDEIEARLLSYYGDTQDQYWRVNRDLAQAYRIGATSDIAEKLMAKRDGIETQLCNISFRLSLVGYEPLMRT